MLHTLPSFSSTLLDYDHIKQIAIALIDVARYMTVALHVYHEIASNSGSRTSMIYKP